MGLRRQDILTLQSVPGIGRAQVMSLARKADEEGFSCDGADGLFGWLGSYVRTAAWQNVSLESVRRAWDQAQKEERYCSEHSIGIATIADSLYPGILRAAINEKGLPSIPSVIYYKGNIALCQQRSVAVIGTRRPSLEAAKATSRIVEAIRPLACNVVSGLAMGIDSIAHEAAIENGIGTIAVLANGLDTVYPRQNSFLAERILAEGGLLLSENPPGAKAEPYRLVERDRIQACLSRAVIVMETRMGGGSFHASRVCRLLDRLLLSYGKEERILPGSGRSGLLQMGAVMADEHDICQLLSKVLGEK